MFKPMLANKYDPAKASWPGFIQPKLDGVRCLHSNDETWTRNEKPHKDHIRSMLAGYKVNVPNGWTLDGELMLPRDRFSFQDTVSAVKKDGENSHLLEYHVYDVVLPINQSFECRLHYLTHDYIRYANSAIRIVATYKCVDAAMFDIMARRFIRQGHEGAIYRSSYGEYKHGRSGRDLLKYKEFVDAEFEIVGVVEGQGKDAGTPVFTCRTVQGDDFNCRPKGTYEWRRRVWNDRERVVGKMLTVRYQELTDGGIPRFPVGVEIRDYE